MFQISSGITKQLILNIPEVIYELTVKYPAHVGGGFISKCQMLQV